MWLLWLRALLCAGGVPPPPLASAKGLLDRLCRQEQLEQLEKGLFLRQLPQRCGLGGPRARAKGYAERREVSLTGTPLPLETSVQLVRDQARGWEARTSSSSAEPGRQKWDSGALCTRGLFGVSRGDPTGQQCVPCGEIQFTACHPVALELQWFYISIWLKNFKDISHNNSDFSVHK